MRKRLAALIICIIMTCAAALPAGAEATFRAGGRDVPGYDYDQYFMYSTQMNNQMYVDNDKDGVIEKETERVNASPYIMFNMINMALVEEGGEGAYASFPSYCFDHTVGVEPGHTYTAGELLHFTDDEEKNNLLRAMMRNSFPGIKDMTLLQNNVNAWLRATDGEDYTPVTNLTVAEAIMATQTAIWSVTNLIEVIDFCEGLNAGLPREDQTIFFEGVSTTLPTEHTEKNCEALYRYLCALEPEKPAPRMDDPFTSVAAVLTPDADGTYTAKITVTLVHVPDARVAAELTAVCGEMKSAPVALRKGVKTYTLTLKHVPSDKANISVSMEGVQTVEDVFLFQAADGRERSQIMGAIVPLTFDVNVRMRATTTVAQPQIPATGDSMNLTALLLLAVMSLTGVMIFRRKRV